MKNTIILKSLVESASVAIALPSAQVSGYFFKGETFFSVFKIIIIIITHPQVTYSNCFARPHENAKTKEIRFASLTEHA